MFSCNTDLYQINKIQMENYWKNIYRIGAITTVIALIGILLDVIIGNITGNNLSELPQTSIDRLLQHNT
jgi:hypothetical protein